MWISRSIQGHVGALLNPSRVVPNILCPSAANMWIIPAFLMIYGVLFYVISGCYGLINTCGKCIGPITRCRVVSIRYFVHNFPPKRSVEPCGRVVD